METIIVKILKVTGYRFPKHEGWFCRDSFSREVLRAVGISCIRCNVRADF